MKTKPGKHDPLYDHFTSLESGKNGVKCSYCSSSFDQNRQEMVHHLTTKCPNVSKEVKSTLSIEYPIYLEHNPNKDLNNSAHSRGGRKRDALYNYYDIIDDTVKNKRVKCMFCSTSMNQSRRRMINHLVSSCTHAPEEVQTQCSNNDFPVETIEETDTPNTIPKHSGRKRDKLYKHFEDIRSGNNRLKMKCLYCSTTMNQNRQRMLRHLSILCPNAPEDVKSPLSNEVMNSDIIVHTTPSNKESESNVYSDLTNSKTSTSDSRIPNTGTFVNTLKGRKRDSLYDHFDDIRVGEHRLRMKCVYCSTSLSQNRRRMVAHLRSKCHRIPEKVKIEWSNREIENIVPTTSNIMDKVSLSISTKQNVQSFYNEMVLSLIACNVPWRFLDHPRFRKAIEALLPNLEHLSAKKASTEILNHLIIKQECNAKNFIETSKFLTLIFDSASDLLQKNITNCVGINEKNDSYLLQVLDGSPFKDSNASESFIKDFIKSLCVPKSVIVFICFHSMNSCSKMRTLFNAKEESLCGLVGGCMVHQSMLFFRDLITACPDILLSIENAINITSVVNSSPNLSSVVLESLKDKLNVDIETFRLCIPSLTRWYSNSFCLKQLLRIEIFLRMAFDKEEDKDYFKKSNSIQSVKLIVGNAEIWSKLHQADKILSAFNYISGFSEMKTTTSGILFSCWIWLYALVCNSNLFASKEIRNFKSLFMNRIKKFGEEHYLVCVALDPRIHGSGLSKTGIRRARSYALHLARKFVPNLDDSKFISSFNDYLKKEGDFGDDCIWEPCMLSSPNIFWEDFYDPNSKHFALSHIGLLICSYYPHVCSFEHCWSSNISEIKQRTYLNLDYIKKVAKIKYSENKGGKQNAEMISKKYQQILDIPDSNSISIQCLFDSLSTSMTDDDKESNPSIIHDKYDIYSMNMEKINYEENDYYQVYNQNGEEYLPLSFMNILNSIERDSDSTVKMDFVDSILDEECFNITEKEMNQLGERLRKCFTI